ncbi:MAG: WYL domain-containing protein [Actinobacteria bacterium]|nr:WYL domain-containing protein [Actinomycetota bacterium]
MSNRLTARDRLTRLLSVIPWVAQQDDGALIEDIVTRFDYPRTQLLDDLQDVVFFVGVHPFTPDSLIEVEIGDERVHIRYADWFSRPLRLTPEEGARLLTAGRSVLPLAESDDDNGAGPLLRALTKLGTALGESAADAVDVRLGHAPSDTLAVLRDALARQRQIDIEYYAYGRDELTERRVDTNRLFSDQGNWYLSGWCHRAVGERVFRVDRIRTVALTDEPNADVGPTNASSFSPDSDDPRVILRLAQSARWVIEQYPVEQVVENDDHIDVTMAVTAIGWLERLLLRLGPAAEILRLDPPLPADLCRHAAARVLTRYQ